MNIKAAVCYRYSWNGENRKIIAILEDGIVTCTDGNGDSQGSYQWADGQLLGSGALSLARRTGVAAEIVRVIQPSNHPAGDLNVTADNDPQTDAELAGISE